MKKVLYLLRQHKLYAKLSKCTFFSPKVEYLRFIVSQDGISVDPTKVKNIVEWPIVPTNANELGWYRIFMKEDYVAIASPFTDLLKKGMGA